MNTTRDEPEREVSAMGVVVSHAGFQLGDTYGYASDYAHTMAYDVVRLWEYRNASARSDNAGFWQNAYLARWRIDVEAKSARLL